MQGSCSFFERKIPDKADKLIKFFGDNRLLIFCKRLHIIWMNWEITVIPCGKGTACLVYRFS